MNPLLVVIVVLLTAALTLLVALLVRTRPRDGGAVEQRFAEDNRALFDRLTALRRFAEDHLGALAGSTTEWLIPPDAEGDRTVVAWTQDPSTVPAGSDQLVCVVNYSPESPSGYFGIPSLPAESTLAPIFSTLGEGHLGGPARHNGFFHRIEGLGPGEARAYLLTPHGRTTDSPTA